ncbi:MAG TPA: hypothetical protein VHM19_22605 [Polyangiales bacterium]|nr:hypothetical protein [Polyangiales bacterium]
MKSWGKKRALAVLVSCWAASACENAVLPSPGEEQQRLADALSVSLSRTIATLPGVAGARVHVALPASPDFAADLPGEHARASVLVHARDAHVHVDPAAVQALVAGAVPGLAAGDVRVVEVPAAVQAAPVPKLTRVGPFDVAESSEHALRAVLIAMLLVQIVLALLVCFVVARDRRRSAALSGSLR